MAFVNEYATQEDIEKYGLENLWEKYKETFGRVFPNTRTGLTIVREREIFLMYIDSKRAAGEDRMKGPESVWILYYQGVNIVVRLWHSSKSIAPSGPLIEVLNEKKRALEEGKAFNHVIIKQVWDLISMTPEHTKDASEDKLKNLLQEALVVYGSSGVLNEPLLIENTIVECNW